ncbi:hypothetical protein HHK36_014441 [Tetracentron sinense]|uniref:COP1-interacting protein 7 n=1 Tax=Tetracentron sinense TaxID=13715 RepID=A0A834ZES5_TETSI|nr:hypothetical protein HHK36_014441 [Tetracentron sinense]
MKSDTPLDHAVFQLSPKRSRCELFVSGDGNTEKLASGLLKPFVTHLKVAEEQLVQAVQSIKLEVEKSKNAGTWFTKGTLERFVRFVSTPEVLELVNTFDAEMSQLEAARRIYSQGIGDQLSSALGGGETRATAAADVTKKELLKAINVRLVAVGQDLTTACARASAAGFTPETVSELQLFADRFGAHHLNEACNKFISLCQRRPDLINTWKVRGDDRAIRSSSGSDMSIDDPTEEKIAAKPNGTHPPQPEATRQRLEQSNPSTCQPPKSSDTCTIRRSERQSNSERDEGRESDGAVEKEKQEESVTKSSQTNQPAMRLSVQDRINLFENKQKEQCGSGGKVVVGKSVELRRLSSDVSAASQVAASQVVEKAVLRRWSGASDMSIDLSMERKETDNSASTLCSSSNSLTQSDTFASASREKHLRGLTDTDASSKAKFSAVPGRVEDPGLKDRAVGMKDDTDSEINARVFSDRIEDVDLTDKAASQTRFRSFLSGAEQDGLRDQVASQTLVRTSLDGAERAKVKEKLASHSQFRGLAGRVEAVGLKDRAAPQTQYGTSPSRVDDVSEDETSQVPLGEFPNIMEDVGLRDQQDSQLQFRDSLSTTVGFISNSKDPLASQIQSKAFSGKLEVGTGSKNQDTFQAQYKGFEGDLLAPQSQWRSFPGKVEEVGKKELVSSEMQFGSFQTKVEDSGRQGMKLQRQISAPEQSKKLQGQKGENNPVHGNGKPVLPGRKVMESEKIFGSGSTAPVEQLQKVRQSKGNQELNDELQIKADELEKLFAAHKLRVPGDQSGSAWRSKPVDMQEEQVVKFQHRKPAEVSPVQLPDKNIVTEPFGSSNNVAEFDFISPMKMVDNRDYGNILKQNISELGFSEESRGKSYDRYMRKRDVKLREEWSLKRAQKEAKMKAMQDSLERSRAEMKAKFSGSADRQDSALHARRRAEKLRTFNVRLAMKNKEQQPIESVQSEEDEDLSEFPEETHFGQDISFGETFLGDGSSRSTTQSKKLLSNRSLSSPTPRTSASPLLRSSIKASNASSGRRRTPPEDPLGQSVPNFSDSRKENMKSSGISKTTTRSQFRNYSRSKSTSEELHLVKEDKPRRSQSMRKNSANPGELKDLPLLNSDSATLTPIRFGKEQTEQIIYNKIPKNSGSKPFLRKGNGIGPGAGSGIAKLKASMASENIKNEEESDELADQLEDSVDMVKEEEGEEFETVSAEESLKAVDFPAVSDNEKAGLSQESEKSSDPGSDDGKVLGSLSQVDPEPVAEVASMVPSMFHTLGHAQDSPGESPASWNSHMHHSFSYTHETSDIDASVDSPMGSPASWNSHSLAQMETDAARMRKKWGSAQKPILVANASHTQSRKDVTKGFKRLLKFGRKTRGSESLVDWISATTSEGDDDTEDGRDPTNRSSEDLRKSRMGFSQGHPSYDGFNDGELFNEQVQALRSSIPAPPENFKLREAHLPGSSLKAPRSFFSLSSFRSKGSESKPR